VLQITLWLETYSRTDMASLFVSKSDIHMAFDLPMRVIDGDRSAGFHCCISQRNRVKIILKVTASVWKTPQLDALMELSVSPPRLA